MKFKFAKVVDSGIKAVATGFRHTQLLKEDGSVWAAGENNYGQLGDGKMASTRVFVKVISSGIQALAAGAWHSMVMNAHGDVWATGANDYGQLGDGSYRVRSKFVRVVPASDGAWFAVLWFRRICIITRAPASLFS